MYEYEVQFQMQAGGKTEKMVIKTLEQIRSNFWSKDLADVIEKQFGKRPANVNSHKFLGEN
jgi:hypothetical protein